MTLSGTISFQGNETSVQDALSFELFTATDGTVTTTMSGGMIVHFDPVTFDVIGVTMNVVLRDDTTGRVYRLENYAIFVSTVSINTIDVTISGRFYDPEEGFVDLVTVTPLRFVGTNAFPSSGILEMSGGGGSKARLTTLSSTDFSLDVDTNGDGVFDFNTGVRLWTGLGGGGGAPPTDQALWTLPLGAKGTNLAVNTATGELYVSGETHGGLPGFTNSGERDVFLAKFNADGTLARIIQWGGAGSEFDLGLKFFGGEVHFLWEWIHAGDAEILMSKYDAQLKALWTSEPLLIGSLSGGFAVDAGGIYSPYGERLGPIIDIGVVKLSHTGVMEGVFSSSVPGYFPAPSGISASGGNNIYITGSGRVGVSESLDPRFDNVFVAKLDNQGNFIWGSAWSSFLGVDQGKAVLATASGVYTGGYWGVVGSLNNCLLLKHDILDGALLWVHQDTRSGGFSQLVSDGDAVYAGGECGLTKFASDGTILWQTAHTGLALERIGNTLFMTDTQSNIIRRFDTATGAQLL